MTNILLETAISTARKAQTEILKFYNQDKPKGLDIDKHIEEIIKQEILTTYPQHNFDGEETGLTNNNSEYTWYCDPIACTMNFNANIPHFATCISLFEKEECVLGVVLDPVTNELFYADKNGAFLNNKQLKASQETGLEKHFFCCSSKHDSDKLQTIQKEFDMYHKLPGSWGLSFAWSAANKFKLNFGNLKDIHGTAPGIYIAKIAGCYIKDYQGNNWDINSKNIVIAQNKEIYDKIRKFI